MNLKFKTLRNNLSEVNNHYQVKVHFTVMWVNCTELVMS